MLKEVSSKIFRGHFSYSSNPYISDWFIELVKEKAYKIVYLMDDSDNSIGLVTGVKDNVLLSPFSAPFGGFHYSHEYIMFDSIYNFVSGIQEYIINNNIKGINITLPPDIYQTNMNAKFVSAFIKADYKLNNPNLLNWIDISSFDGSWVYNKVLNRCRKALKNELKFKLAESLVEKEESYNLIKTNRNEQNRKIHMTLNDLLDVSQKTRVDFFQVRDKDDDIVGAGVLYRGSKEIIQAIFMGDNLNKRDLGAIDFLYMSIYNYYKDLGFKYIDFGTSSLEGDPNTGLLRFKEIHNCKTSLQYSFSWFYDNEK